MVTRERLEGHLVAAGSMLGGSALVFATVLYMNQQTKPPKEEPRVSETTFQVERKPPPKKRRERTEQAKTPPRRAMAQAPRAPEISSAISGVSLETPVFAGGVDVGAVSRDLIGSFDQKGPMSEGALDQPPKPRSRAGAQEYPPKARQQGLEGYVLLNIYVRGDGNVGAVKVLDAEPKGVFDDAAVEFVRQWSFEPGVYQGESVDAWIKQKIVYQLQKS